MSSIVSLVYTMEDGATVEMGLAGSDGVAGIALFLGGDKTPNRAVVQIAGGASRLPAKVVQEEFKTGRGIATLAAALYARPHHPDLTDRGL